MPSPLQIFSKKSRDASLSPIAMISLYDAPTAALCCDAGADALLVGDSMGNVILGYDNTVSVDIEAIAHHTGAVVRGVKSSSRPDVPVIADLPFGSYHGSESEIVANATKLLKAGAIALKLEGAGERALRAIDLLLEMGVPVMGHIGFTPQSVLKFQTTVQGKTAPDAKRLMNEALSLEKAGCFGVVLEAMAQEVAAQITNKVQMATIGIGAGSDCDGQVLVWHDLAGLLPGKPFRFVRQYAKGHQVLLEAARSYVNEVKSKEFPSLENAWNMTDEERRRWENEP
ncbi:MAG TPA: 3-methyl-2-oxobutanoate hydroxymethyltransferase [Abditibacteriaceae bacterium]|jgi:3-methyl-2-oxobutanoate hydroxymethyltransferase